MSFRKTLQFYSWLDSIPEYPLWDILAWISIVTDILRGKDLAWISPWNSVPISLRIFPIFLQNID